MKFFCANLSLRPSWELNILHANSQLAAKNSLISQYIVSISTVSHYIVSIYSQYKSDITFFLHKIIIFYIA